MNNNRNTSKNINYYYVAVGGFFVCEILILQKITNESFARIPPKESDPHQARSI